MSRLDLYLVMLGSVLLFVWILMWLFGWAHLDGDSEDPFRASTQRASPVVHALPPTERFGSRPSPHTNRPSHHLTASSAATG